VQNFFAVDGANPATAGQPTPSIPQIEEQTEKYLPSLDFKRKIAGKSVLLTGATGAVGSAVARKLLKCNVRKLCLFVRDRDAIDVKIVALMNDPAYKDVLYVEQVDFREPQRIEQKFSNSMVRCFQGVIDTVILCHGVVVEKGLITCTIPAFD